MSKRARVIKTVKSHIDRATDKCFWRHLRDDDSLLNSCSSKNNSNSNMPGIIVV